VRAPAIELAGIERHIEWSLLRGPGEKRTMTQSTASKRHPDSPSPIADRIATLDWQRLAEELDARGATTTGPILTPGECARLAALYNDESRFRSRIVMARHGFGQGEYQYFADPLPDLVADLRRDLYPRLAPIAKRWQAMLGQAADYPATLADFLARCHGAGDYNCLHQDVYGEIVFPLQVAILLSRPGSDFTGGEFVLTEQRPRMQSRPEVVTLSQGEAVIFAVSQRPVQGSRGAYRVTMRHGVSRVRTGHRMTLGVIFHDAT
jgi:hypothetical protein